MNTIEVRDLVKFCSMYGVSMTLEELQQMYLPRKPKRTLINQSIRSLYSENDNLYFSNYIFKSLCGN